MTPTDLLKALAALSDADRAALRSMLGPCAGAVLVDERLVELRVLARSFLELAPLPGDAAAQARLDALC